MATVPTSAKVVVIGAGIVGNSLVHHLARLGWRDIVQIDQGPLPNPGGSTGHASNFIFPVDHTREITDLTLDSMRQYQEMGVFTESGGFEIARTEARMEELRRAISLAVDRQAIVDTVYLGAGVPVFGPITPGHGAWYVASLPHDPHDVARARQLLAEIGLKDRNGDGMFEDAAGHPARFSVMTQKGHTIREKTVALLQSQLKQLGLGVDVVPLEFGALVASINKGDYEAAYFGVSADSPDPARNPEFWMSYGSFHLWNPAQPKPATEWEAKVDDLMRQQTASRDLEKRRQLFTQVQQTWAEHLPIIYFAAPKVTIAMNARVHGATPSVLQPPILWNAEALSVTAPAGLASRR